MNRNNRLAPKARAEQLVVKELGGETPVYDEKGHIVALTATEAQTHTCTGNREPCNVLPSCPGFNCDGICFPD